MKNKIKLLNTDGHIKVGDEVVYNTSKDLAYTGDKKYVKAKVLSIQKLDWGNNKSYEYHIDFGGYDFWVNGNMVRKLRKGEEVGRYKIGKYEIGERVFIPFNYDDTAEIVGVKMNNNNKIDYICEIGHGWHKYRLLLSDDILRTRKNYIDGDKFKVGDSIYFKKNSKHRSHLIKEIYTYDDDPIIYYKLDNIVINLDETLWAKLAPPKIIISVNDPYGEEDWSDEE